VIYSIILITKRRGEIEKMTYSEKFLLDIKM